jgi:methionyl-tRNA formyltransferase
MNMRFVFVGNRRFVLQEMLAADLDIAAIFVISGSHLERDIKNGELTGLRNCVIVNNKQALLDVLKNIQFDVLVSNGCPYILPVSQMPRAHYINIHPSCLPDLRGIDPVIGSVLYAKDSGATCHVMDDGIDTGSIISQVRIPYSEDIDVSLMYQLSFIAEKKVFRDALTLDFVAQTLQVDKSGDINYKRSPEDRIIEFSEPNELILRKVKAFSNRSQGCEFSVDGKRYRFYQAALISNPFLIDLMSEVNEGVVAFSYENSIIFSKDREIFRFMDITSLTVDNEALPVGTKLFS